MTVCTGKHQRPVHFNRGKHGHLWLCIACGKQLSGPKIPDDECEALSIYANYLVGNGKDLRGAKPQTALEANGDQMENTLQITLNFKSGTTPDIIAAQLRMQAGIFEGMSPKEAASRTNTDGEKAPAKAASKKAAPVVEPVDTDDDEDFAPKKSTKKAAAASFDDDDAEETEAVTEDEEEDFTTPPKKTAEAKKPKLTVDMVNDACKTKAKETDRETVLKILKKFKVKSVSELKPEQYGAVIEAMTE